MNFYTFMQLDGFFFLILFGNSFKIFYNAWGKGHNLQKLFKSQAVHQLIRTALLYLRNV